MTIDASGNLEIVGGTPAGELTIANSHPEATMTAEIPSGALAAAVPFAVTHVDPAALPPESGTGPGGDAATIDPVAAWQFAFDVPTLNQDATLTFEIQVDGLEPSTRQDFLAALDSGAATLATQGDPAGGTYRAFPLCFGGAAPSPTARRGDQARLERAADERRTRGGPLQRRCRPLLDLGGGGRRTLPLDGGSPLESRQPHTLEAVNPTPSNAAEPTPSNAFGFGKVRLNKRKGTASLAVKVPGPGSLSFRGKGISGQRKAVRAAGTVKLAVRPMGKAKRKLAGAGKLTVKVAVTYRPSGGDPATKTKTISLRRSRQG